MLAMVTSSRACARWSCAGVVPGTATSFGAPAGTAVVRGAVTGGAVGGTVGGAVTATAGGKVGAAVAGTVVSGAVLAVVFGVAFAVVVVAACVVEVSVVSARTFFAASGAELPHAARKATATARTMPDRAVIRVLIVTASVAPEPGNPTPAPVLLGPKPPAP